jgi:hypothetical protein
LLNRNLLLNLVDVTPLRPYPFLCNKEMAKCIALCAKILIFAAFQVEANQKADTSSSPVSFTYRDVGFDSSMGC